MNFYEIDITDPWDSGGTTPSCRVTPPPPPPPPPPPYMSAGEIRLCYIPSLVSSVLIASRHNTSCSSSFPRPRRQTGGRKAGVHLKITETRSCHLRAFVIKVLPCSIWFTLGMLMRTEAHIAADELSSFLDVWTHQFTAWLYYVEPLRNCCSQFAPRSRGLCRGTVWTVLHKKGDLAHKNASKNQKNVLIFACLIVSFYGRAKSFLFVFFCQFSLFH